MGDPKKHRKKYETPVHPWEGARIEEERALIRDFGLKNKQEIWKMGSVLRRFKDRAKSLVSLSGRQAEVEYSQLMGKLESLSLCEATASLDVVLGLSISDVMNRRLQTKVVRKKMAHSMKQARQFITHGHISVAGTPITSPSYMVKSSEEDQIEFTVSSSLASEDHPERSLADSPEEIEAKAKKKEMEDFAAKNAAEAAEDPVEAQEQEVAVAVDQVEQDEKPVDDSKEAPAEAAEEKSDETPAKEAPAESKEESAESAEEAKDAAESKDVEAGK